MTATDEWCGALSPNRAKCAYSVAALASLMYTTGRPSRSSRAARMLKPPQPGWRKLVAPLEDRTPSALAGPGVSSPTAVTAARSTPVTSSTCANEAASDSIATSGPSRTRLGRSSMCSIRNRPDGSSTVALFMVPPLSTPTMNDWDEVAI